MFVTGGSGFIGRHVLRRLRRDNVEIRALARSAASQKVVSDLGATAVAGDLFADNLATAMSGCDAVIHLAAKTDEWGLQKDYDRVNIQGTDQMLRTAKQNGVGRFVHISTEAVLLDGDPLENVDESAPYPTGKTPHYGWSKREAEKRALAAGTRNLQVIVLRPRFVWGPDDTTVLPKLKAAVEQGRFRWFRSGEQQTSTCHVDNLVEALWLSLTVADAEGVYFITDGPPTTVREMLTRLLESQGVKAPEGTMPLWVARWVARVGEGVWRLFGIRTPPPLTQLALHLLAEDVVVSDRRAREHLGYVPVISLERGLHALRRQAGSAPVG